MGICDPALMNDTMSRRVTILQCDDVPQPDRGRHGDVHQQVTKHLRQVSVKTGLALLINVVDVRVQTPPTPDGTDLYVITGSAAEPFSSEPWIARLRDWLGDAAARGERMFGICFGHQVICHALGGQTARAADWEIGIVGMRERIALGRGGETFDSMPENGRSVRLIMSHQDEVTSLPEGALHWLEGEFCAQQGMIVPGQIATVQGHPEYWHAQVSDLYERRRATLGDRRTDAAQHSVAGVHDGESLTANVLEHLLKT